jgi:hypothetical protein
MAHMTSTQQPRTHDLPLTPAHVHWGYFDSRVPPVLRIASGDRVRVGTMIAGGLQRVRLAGVAESEIPDPLKAVELGVVERGPGVRPMTGPIFVQDAEPGDTFLHPFGVNVFNPGIDETKAPFPDAVIRRERRHAWLPQTAPPAWTLWPTRPRQCRAGQRIAGPAGRRSAARYALSMFSNE